MRKPRAGEVWFCKCYTTGWWEIRVVFETTERYGGTRQKFLVGGCSDGEDGGRVGKVGKDLLWWTRRLA